MNKQYAHLVDEYFKAKERFVWTLHNTGPGESVGIDPSKKIYDEIKEFYPDLLYQVKEREIELAIRTLKNSGYRVMKRIVTENYEEV